MEYLVLAVIGWAAVIILLPMERIKELIMVPVTAFIWMVVVTNYSVAQNYYRYYHTLIPIGHAPLFQALAAAAIGLLMINWLTESPLSKLISSVLTSIFLAVLRTVYVQLGAFKYIRFDSAMGFSQTLAFLSLFIWISLAVAGQEKVYGGVKSRFGKKQLMR